MEKTNTFIAHNHELDKVTLEDVMNALGVKCSLNLEERQKCSLIEDINNASKALAGYETNKVRNIPTTVFDTLYDMPVKELSLIYKGLNEKISYKRYQAGLNGQVQGHDF
jgi:hypothetical protein